MRKVLILCVLMTLTPATQGADWSTPSSWLSSLETLWQDITAIVLDHQGWIQPVGSDEEPQEEITTTLLPEDEITSENAESIGRIGSADLGYGKHPNPETIAGAPTGPANQR